MIFHGLLDSSNGGHQVGGGSINFFSIKHSVSGDRCRVARHIFNELVIEATYNTHDTHDTHDVETIDTSLTNRRSDQAHIYIMSPSLISGQSSAVPIHLKTMENLYRKPRVSQKTLSRHAENIPSPLL